MDSSHLREILLEVIEDSLEAQLRAVRRLRATNSAPGPRTSARGKEDRALGRSQVDMAYDILADGQPLHITDILAAIQKRFGVKVDRESLVSALSKRVVRKDRFRRAGKNTFSRLPIAQP